MYSLSAMLSPLRPPVSYTAASHVGAFLALVQAILGPVLLFQMGLAIRRRLRL
ncbi:MAG: hypothetical protein HYU88_02550 [Chloroflexi bacterium]|nr:hypothetical protein [Chloroflexota bacterium]